MACLARVVLPGSPYHVTQRGIRRAPTFFEDSDYILYLKWLSEAASNARTEVWAYCLMPNYVHVILTPEDEQGLRRTFADGRCVSRQRGALCGDEPVRAGLVERAEDWRWSKRTGLFWQARFARSLTRRLDLARKTGCSKRISCGHDTGAFDHEHH